VRRHPIKQVYIAMFVILKNMKGINMCCQAC
jgi:hypothetical protein